MRCAAPRRKGEMAGEEKVEPRKRVAMRRSGTTPGGVFSSPVSRKPSRSVLRPGKRIVSLLCDSPLRGKAYLREDAGR